MGRAEERCVFSCGPSLSASAQRCPENSCAPSCPDPKAVAGTRGVEVTFLAFPESLGNQIGLFVSALGLPNNQKGYGRDHLHKLANSYLFFKTQNSFF